MRVNDENLHVDLFLMVGGLLELDDDLAEVAARFLEPKGVSDFGQGKAASGHLTLAADTPE